MSRANTLIILDFETTGLSPALGDRAIEIGAIRIKNGEIIDQFQELMNPGFRIDSFIENYTGISNAMLSKASSCADVMHKFSDFIGDDNLVAHNASFDKNFLDAEMKKISKNYSGKFACSMLAARRLYPCAPNHKLSTLVKYANITVDGVFHRALDDSKMTTGLWLAMLTKIKESYGIKNIPFNLMQHLIKTPKKKVSQFLKSKSLN
ncbi:MAG: 3'-5' exonuclease [Alcanivoracaceae bacterium]|nr:3'-5' exonuclease [Alcanivoracaceae bacterium]